MGKLRAAALAAAGVLVLLPATAAAHTTKIVYPGGPAKWASKLGIAGVDNFLINRVTINAGDTVVWSGASLSSGFHTVDLPKLRGADLPLFIPSGGLVSGVNDAAGNPFWFNGKVPVVGLNPALGAASGGHTYNGRSRVDSGLPLSPKPQNFAVRFTKPGTYRYFCDVHPGMMGWVIVRPKGKRIPSAKDDAATLKAEEKAYAAAAKRLVKKVKPAANTVSVGASGPGGLELFAMFPATLTVKAGTTVKFSMAPGTREVHTASFGPEAYLKPLSDSFASPAPSPAALYPSDPAHITLTPTSHGNGFANTGAMDRDKTTPLPPSNTITFTTVGIYHYQCLIHPFMHGTIVVK